MLSKRELHSEFNGNIFSNNLSFNNDVCNAKLTEVYKNHKCQNAAQFSSAPNREAPLPPEASVIFFSF